jgi:ankyrin repeat protein
VDVEFLLQCGADLNAVNNNGQSALMMACMSNHKDIVALLLANDADVNARDQLGRTALAWALRRQHHEIVELLTSYDVQEKGSGSEDDR